jgi:hypothetical protein
MKTSWKIVGLVSMSLCLMLLFAAAPSLASDHNCGPGGSICEGCSGTCSGLACAVPYQSQPSPGSCTAAQQAQGGYEITTTSNCAGSLEGVCKCYLPAFYQITQANCARVYYSTVPWEEPVALASSASCATSIGPMTPATLLPPVEGSTE